MRVRTGLAAVFILVALVAPASATSITVDEILYASGTNAANLSGTVEMTLVGSTLTITLKNTSTDAAGSGAGVLLTGIGFQLPTGIAISGGTANMTGSTAVNFTAPTGGDVSKYWGYDTNPLDSGVFQNEAWLDYNTVVGAMDSLTTTNFSGSTNLTGPDYGLISALEKDKLGGGMQAINNQLIITLNLSSKYPFNADELLKSIQAGNVALSFGSPSLTTVPEPGSLSLLGIGLTSLAALMRRSRKRDRQNAA